MVGGVVGEGVVVRAVVGGTEVRAINIKLGKEN